MVHLHTCVCGLLVLVMWISAVHTQSTDSCTKQINSCACQTAKGFINLERLDQAKHNNQPKWSGEADPDDPDTTYAYNPCSSFSVDSGCSSVAGCQTQTGVNYAIGTQDTAKFDTDATLGTLLVYTTTEGRTLKVQLVCDSSQDGALSNAGEDPNNPGTYDMTLTTKDACSELAPPPPGYGPASGGISPGSIMLIILFACITIYLVAGVIFNKFYKGANGKEVLPNSDFWIALPGLARDGVLYSWSKVRGLCGGRSGYDDV